MDRPVVTGMSSAVILYMQVDRLTAELMGEAVHEKLATQG
jgi:hypothetical protein